MRDTGRNALGTESSCQSFLTVQMQPKVGAGFNISRLVASGVILQIWLHQTGRNLKYINTLIPGRAPYVYSSFLTKGRI